MTNNLDSCVEISFSTLMQTQGYDVVDRGCDSSFGDAFVTRQGGNVMLRVVRDRGRLSAQFGSAASDRFFGLEAVAEFLNSASERSPELWDIDDIAAFAFNRHEVLSEAFGPDRVAETEVRLERLERLMFRDRFGRPL